MLDAMLDVMLGAILDPMLDAPPYLLFLWNVIINSTFAFCTLRILLALFLRCYPFSSRTKAIWGLLLFMHLIIHPLTYNWMQWGSLNPWQAPSGTRQISMVLCYPNLHMDWGPLRWIPTSSLQMQHVDGKTFTPADCLIPLVPVSFIWASVLLAGFGAAGLLLRCIRRLICERRFFKKLRLESMPLIHKLPCSAFAETLTKAGVEVRLSSTLKMPCAYGVWRPQIFMPNALYQTLTSDECQAILMHEWGHLRYRDTLAVLLCHVLACLFWWIPTRSVFNRLVAWQEEACDDMIHLWKRDPHDLAMALVSVMRLRRDVPDSSQCMLARPFMGRSMQACSPLHRIKRLICDQSPPLVGCSGYGLYNMARYWLLTILMITVIFGKFWAF